VRVVTASIEQAVRVPVGALFPHGEGMAVYRLDGRRARLQLVELGARNASLAWVRKGLAPGQLVVIYPPAGLADGRKVRVRTPLNRRVRHAGLPHHRIKTWFLPGAPVAPVRG
jgi:HlyD family secretion protein